MQFRSIRQDSFHDKKVNVHFQVDIQVYENLSEEAKDRLYLETLKRTVNISGGKKDPESLRKEAICDALDSLVEKEGSRQTSMSVANVCETSDSTEKSGFLAEEMSKASMTGLRGSREKDGRGVNISRGKERKRGNGERESEECFEGKETNGKDYSKPVPRGRGRGRGRT